MHDGEAARAEYALDLVLHFCCEGESSHTRLSINTVTVPTLELSFIDWQSEFGGFTCYVANEEDEEVSVDYRVNCNCRCVHSISVIITTLVSSLSQLLTVYPEENSLALVYRDKKTLKFVKHVNHKSSSDSANSCTCSALYDFSFVYYE